MPRVTKTKPASQPEKKNLFFVVQYAADDYVDSARGPFVTETAAQKYAETEFDLDDGDISICLVLKTAKSQKPRVLEWE